MNKHFIMRLTLIAIVLIIFYAAAFAQKPRARDIGIPFDWVTGRYNAITDIQGVEVGYSTFNDRFIKK
jgi:hypothetical protein